MLYARGNKPLVWLSLTACFGVPWCVFGFALPLGRTASGLLTLEGAKHLCTGLGLPERATQLSEHGSGWTVVAAINQTSGVAPAMFAQWWCEEELNDAVERHITVTAFPGSRLNER
jgi:hypothetical protein